ncbi:MAG: MFS transporter [Ignavibacteriae bacterium]|nr:MFS transporter [Ignavibacteriota bacterium]MCI0707942.1 MFS transporter [Ignavibacteriota bacterium]
MSTLNQSHNEQQNEQQPVSRGKVFAWALYDFANTAFYVLILTVGYPLYFKKIVAADSTQSDALWGLAFSISMLFVALLSPVLGAVADYGAGKKRFLGIFTVLCVLATAGLFFVEGSMIVWGIVLLILANIGFEAGLVFYDAFLPEITTERSYGRVSGYGFAVGYIGSLVTLFTALPLFEGGFEPENLLNVRISFLVAAGFFFFFALPLFAFVPDRQRFAPLKLNFAKVGFERLRNTIREFPLYRNVAKFLLSYFIYIDAINTIIVFSSIFADETLHLTIQEIIYFFIIVQTSAIIGSLVFGVLADKLGHKKTLTLSLLIWVVIVVIAYFTTDKTTFFVVGFLAGIALGSSQSSSRSLMSAIVPADKKTEFFGFYSFFGKASAILGPLLFGVLSSNFNQRVAILAIGILLIGGLLLLQRVEVKRAEST